MFMMILYSTKWLTRGAQVGLCRMLLWQCWEMFVGSTICLLIRKPFLRVLCFFTARVLRNLVRCRHTMLWASQASGLVQRAKFGNCLPCSQCATPWFVTIASTYSIWGGPTHLSTPLCSTGYFVALRIFGTLKGVTKSVSYIVWICDILWPRWSTVQNHAKSIIELWACGTQTHTHTHTHTHTRWHGARQNDR